MNSRSHKLSDGIFRVIIGGILLLLILTGLVNPARSEINVTVTGPGGSTSAVLPDAGGPFSDAIPLSKNAVNTINVTAKDANGQTASAQVSVTQVSLSSVAVAQISAQPLSVQQIQQLVNDGVINLDNPENYNVSQFDIVMTIGQQAVPFSIPVIKPKDDPPPTGTEPPFSIPMGSGDGGGLPKVEDAQIVVFETQPPSPPGQPAPPPIPGVIVIEGKIKSLKEFYNVKLLLMNTSGIFTLSNVSAKISFPDAGLSSILPTDGINTFGDILPGDGTTPGQKEEDFIIRGDEIGDRRVQVDFGGTVTGPGITDPIPFNGSAVTDVEVKGPPTFQVQVLHPDYVTATVPYTLEVDVTNTSSDVPALYAGLAIDVGADAQLVKCQNDSSGNPVCTPIDGSDARNLGNLMPGDTVKETFTINPLTSGPLSSCMGMSDQNISLQVLVGNIGCMVGTIHPIEGVPTGTPSVNVLPAPNAIGLSIDSPVSAFFSAAMNGSTITTGDGGTFNVYDGTGTLVPGQLRLTTIAGNTVAIWQVNDGITNRLQPQTGYRIHLTKGITDQSGTPISNDYYSQFTTTGVGTQDNEPPTVVLSVDPPVNPNYVLPGQVIKIDVYTADQGSGIARVELRLKDLSTPGAAYSMVGQKTVYSGDKPPFIFSLDSGNLIPGHNYQALVTAFDGAGNAQQATLALLIAASADPPTVTLPADPGQDNPVLQGISVSLTPTLTGGVRQVYYFLDASSVPIDPASPPAAYDLQTISPYQTTLGTLHLGLGKHTITALAIDAIGQTGQATYTFSLAQNGNAPTVSFPGMLSEAQYITGVSFSVAGSATDPVGVQSIQYFLDDPLGTTTPLAQNTSAFVFSTNGVSLGQHAIYLIARNKLGVANAVNAVSTFSFSIVPVPSGNAPNPPTVSKVSYPSNDLVTVSGSATDPGAQVQITNTRLGITITVFAGSDRGFSATVPGEAGDTLSLVEYVATQSTSPSSAVTTVVQAAPVLQSISLSPAGPLSFSIANAYSDIRVIGKYSDGTSVDITSGATFTTGASDVATVSASGRIAAVSNGTTAITATVGAFNARIQVTVNIVVLNSITVDQSSFTFAYIDQTQQVTVTGHYSDGTTSTIGSGLSYTVGDHSVVSVSPSGLLTAEANGSTIMTVSYPGVQPVAVNVAVDTALDTPPVVTILSPSSGTLVERNNVVQVTVSAREQVSGISTINLSVTGEASYSTVVQEGGAGSATAQFSFTVPATAVIGGNVYISAWAQDIAGVKSGPVTNILTVVDKTPPVVTITGPAQQSKYNAGDTITLNISATDAGGVAQISFAADSPINQSSSRTIAPASNNASASFSITAPYGALSPDVKITAFSKDASGNVGTSAPVHIVLTGADITPPKTQVVSVTDDTNPARKLVTYVVIKKLEELDHVELYFRRNGIGTFNRYTDSDNSNPKGYFHPQSGDMGTITFDSTKMGGDGTYEFYSIGVDTVGNRESAPIDANGTVTAQAVATVQAGTAWTTISTATFISDGDTTFDNMNIRVRGTTLTVQGHHTFHNIDLLQKAVLTHPAATLGSPYRLDIEAWSLAVDGTSSINVDARGYLGGNQGGNNCTGETLSGLQGSTYRSGGSNGGPGGSYDGTPNPLYDTLLDPENPGSGGSCGGCGNAGGSGGGMIKLRTINIATDKSISANGGVGDGCQAGSGSGGGINITTATLSGLGRISATGGVNEVGGGGGRIAIYYTDMSTLNAKQISVTGGQGSYAAAGDGTIFLKSVSESNGSLVIDGGGNASSYTPLSIPPGFTFDNITIQNHARVVADQPVQVASAFTVLTDSIVTHSVDSTAGLSITAATVEIDATSSIDVSAKGYPGGHNSGNSSPSGKTLGDTLGASYRSGGSYGGYGAAYDGSANPPYGHPVNAVYLGSGGTQGGCGNAGGNGGGLAQITATQKVLVNGNLLANGGTGSGCQAGSGSGGSIRIQTPLLEGSGYIAANGGANEVGGGGGRIAIFADSIGDPDVSGLDFGALRNISAFGGHGNYAWGSAGTMLFKRTAQQYGDLYVDDNMSGSTSSAYTPLSPLGFGSIVALSEDTASHRATITTNGAIVMTPGGMIGVEINPNISQDQTYFVVDNGPTTLTIDTTGKPALSSVATMGSSYAGIYRFDNVFFRRGGFLVLGDQLSVTDTMNLAEYGMLTHYDSSTVMESRVDLTANTIVVDSTSSINVDYRGYLGGYHNQAGTAGLTAGNIAGSSYRSGGSYGGLGADYGGNSVGVYGSVTNPATLGSGGSSGGCSNKGGDGGGWARITASNLVLDGTISANGEIGHGCQAGSGSGGTLNLNVMNITGAGTVRANGGGNEVGGGGGRIAVYYTSLGMAENQFQVLGGLGNYASGGNGTIFFKNPFQTYGDLYIDGQGGNTPFDSSPIPSGYTFDNITLTNKAMVVTSAPINTAGSFTVSGGSVLTHPIGFEAGLEINADNVTIDPTSSIDVSGRGYQGGGRDGNSSNVGLTLGGMPGGAYRSGGSYGGSGGSYDGATNTAYGHPAKPAYLGSGGSMGACGNWGGNGGGLVQINASGTLSVEGTILANGMGGNGCQAGSGSGGSISLTASVLKGGGSISANGGGNEVGGGGGRIALRYDTLSAVAGENFNNLLNITALGGHGDYRWGSAGTVLTKNTSQVFGDLYIDDGMISSTSSAASPLTRIGFGTALAVSDDSLNQEGTLVTDGTVLMIPGGLVGLEINPNLAQNVTYPVVGNGTNMITVSTVGKPALSSVAANGSQYAGIYRFDNVFFRRGGFLVLGDQLEIGDTLNLAEHGEITHYDATMNSQSRVDIIAKELNIDTTSSINVDAKGYLGGYQSGNGCTGQTLPGLTGSSYRSGGSYGGEGGAYSGTANALYGSASDPAALGSGGSCGGCGNPGGNGGGWIRIVAPNVMVNGAISAAGGNGQGCQAGSGSGGTVNITASTIEGSGNISANGGGNEVGGGGGRIEINYNLNYMNAGQIAAKGGQGSYSSGQTGTVHY